MRNMSTSCKSLPPHPMSCYYIKMRKKIFFLCLLRGKLGLKQCCSKLRLSWSTSSLSFIITRWDLIKSLWTNTHRQRSSSSSSSNDSACLVSNDRISRRFSQLCDSPCNKSSNDSDNVRADQVNSPTHGQRHHVTLCRCLSDQAWNLQVCHMIWFVCFHSFFFLLFFFFEFPILKNSDFGMVGISQHWDNVLGNYSK